MMGPVEAEYDRRPPDAAPAVRAVAEALPAEDGSFDGAMAILTIHHRTDYAPGILADDHGRFPPTDVIEAALGGGSTETVPIPADCEDLFLGALWSRPELVLDPRVRAATSGFARLDAEGERRTVERLRGDLESGEWDRRYGQLRARDSFDVGVRLVRSP